MWMKMLSLFLWCHPIKSDCLANKLRFILPKRFRDHVNYNKAHFPNKWAFHSANLISLLDGWTFLHTKKTVFVYIICITYYVIYLITKKRKEKKKKKLLCLRQNSLTWNRISVISLAQVFFLAESFSLFFFCLFE